MKRAVLCALMGALSLPAFAQNKKSPANLEQDLRIKASLLKPHIFCTSLGTLLRNPDISDRGQIWENVMLQRAADFNVRAAHVGYIRERRLSVGMPWCAVYAALGMPSHGNRTVTASGERHQLVYERPRIYVYIENDRVTAWQD